MNQASRGEDPPLGLLHAYLDNELSDEDREAVETFLTRYPEVAARMNEYAQQNASFHEMYDRYLGEPLPEELAVLTRRLVQRTAGRPRIRLALPLAAGVAALAILAGGVWLDLRWQVGARTERAVAALIDVPVQEGVVTEAETAQATPANEFAQLARSAIMRTYGDRESPSFPTIEPDKKIVSPNFTGLGFELVEGRALSGGGGGVHLVYRGKNGARVSLYASPNAGTGSARLAFAEEGPVSYLVWSDEVGTYSLVGDADRRVLLEMGKLMGGSWSAEPPRARPQNEAVPQQAPAAPQPDPAAKPADNKENRAEGSGPAKAAGDRQPRLAKEASLRQGIVPAGLQSTPVTGD